MLPASTAVIHMALAQKFQVEDLALSMGFAFAGEGKKDNEKD